MFMDIIFHFSEIQNRGIRKTTEETIKTLLSAMENNKTVTVLLLVHTCTILNKYAYSVSKADAHVYSKIFKTNNLLMKLTLYC